MFDRVEGYFVIAVNNIRALEYISKMLYEEIRKNYYIQIEVFPNVTIYTLFVDMDKSLDEKITKYIKENLSKTNGIKLLEES